MVTSRREQLEEFLPENRVISTTISGNGMTHGALSQNTVSKLVYFHLSNLGLFGFVWSLLKETLSIHLYIFGI